MPCIYQNCSLKKDTLFSFNLFYVRIIRFSRSSVIGIINLILFQCLYILLETLYITVFTFFKKKNQVILMRNKYHQSLLQVFLYHENLQPHHLKILFWFLKIFIVDGFALIFFFILLVTPFQISSIEKYIYLVYLS